MSAGKSGSTFERTYFSLFIINKLKFQITKKSMSELSTKKSQRRIARKIQPSSERRVYLLD